LVKSPSITTNESAAARRITIMANVEAKPDSTYPIIINPYRLFVSRVGKTDVTTATFTITNVSNSDLKLSVVDKPRGIYKISIPKVVKAKSAVTCRLKLLPGQTLNAFENCFTIELSDTTKTRFTVPVTRRIINSQDSIARPKNEITTPIKPTSSH